MSRMHKHRARRAHRRNGDKLASRRARRGGHQQQWRVVEDSESVFRRAIIEGVLSADPDHRQFAGHYMYLFHDENGVAWFKHRNSRKCVRMRAERHRGLIPI